MHTVGNALAVRAVTVFCRTTHADPHVSQIPAATIAALTPRSTPGASQRPFGLEPICKCCTTKVACAATIWKCAQVLTHIVIVS